MPSPTHRCPDCGRLCDTATELADHALYVHVDAPTPAAHIRPQRFGGIASGVAIGIAVLLGLGVYVLAFLAPEWIERDSAPPQPQSVVHQMAADLERSGEIDDFRSVEPAAGWDVEYELDGGDGLIRIRNEGVRGKQELEYETFLDDDLYEAIRDVLRSYGFRFED